MATTDHAEGAAGERPGEDGVDGAEQTGGSSAGAASRSTGGERPGNGSRTYEVTYAFEGHHRGDYDGFVDRVGRALSSLRAAGVDVGFRGATARFDGTGRVLAVSVRFAAPDEGAVGRLNCRAVLPVSGIRRVEP